MNETTRVIRIVVDSSKARSGSEESRQALKRMEDQVAATRSSMDKLSAGWGGMMRGFAAATALLAVVASVKAFATGIAEAGDEIRSTTARFNVLTGAADGSRVALDTVYKVARNAGVGLADAGAAFSRLAIAAGEFGATTDQVARVTDVVLKLGRVGGASSQELSAGVQQLGQALASGRLQGDELRSILEGMPLVGKAIAREFGVGLGELRKLGEEGKLVSDRVFKALIAAGSDADAQFRKLPPTLEAAGNRASNAWKLFSAALDDSLGISKLLASGLDSTADRAERVAARIRGDVNVALADTIAKIAALEEREKGRRESQAKRDALPADAPARADLGGQNRPLTTRELYDIRNRRGAPTADAERARLEAERLRLSQIANSQADFELGERDRQFRESQAKARGAADARVRELEEKALTGSAKAARDYNQSVARLKDDLDKGLISQDRFNKGMVAAKSVLDQAAGGAKATAESVKALNEATREADFAKLLADSAYLGAGRLAEIEAQAKAVEKAIDTLGKRDAVFEGRYAGQLLSKRGDDFRKDFTLETAEIERQNRLLEAQVRLAGERPEIAEREIALLRVRNELEAKGQDAAKVNVEARVEALVAQEKLNRQLEDGKRSAELWAEPFKNAIQSVQGTMTDFFERLYSGGVRGFGDLAESMKRIWIRLIAEMTTLAVIRPSIEWMTGTSASAGGSSGGMGGIGDAFGFISRMFSGGAGRSSFTGGAAGVGNGVSGGGFDIGGIFGSLFGGGGGGGGGGAYTSVPIGGAASAGQTVGTGGLGGMLGNLGGGGGLFGGIGGGGMSLGGMFMGGFGAISGIMGAINSSSTVGKIGGGMQAAGSVIGMIPTPWTKAIGMGLQIIGSILPMFAPPKDISSASVGTFNPATGKYGSRVAFAHTVTAPQVPELGNNVLESLRGFGGSVASGMSAPNYYIWTGKNRAGTENSWDAGFTENAYFGNLANAFAGDTDFRNKMARRALWTPGGDVALPFEDTSTDREGVMRQLAVLIPKLMLAEGSLTGLSGTSQTIIRNFTLADPDAMARALQWGKDVYDLLSRTEDMTAAEKAITDLKDSFQAAIRKAEEYGLATDKLVAAQSRAINKYATDFGRNIEDQLLGISDPTALQRVQIEREREQALKEWDYLQQEFLKGNISTLIERNKVQQLYDEKLKSIFSQTLASLENFERRVRFGDLSAANPLESLAGALGAYKANAAQALTGNATAINQYEAFAEAAIRAQAAYGGNDYAAADLRRQILEEIAAIQGRGSVTSANGNELVVAQEETNRLLRELLDRMQAA